MSTSLSLLLVLESFRGDAEIKILARLGTKGTPDDPRPAKNYIPQPIAAKQIVLICLELRDRKNKTILLFMPTYLSVRWLTLPGESRSHSQETALG